MTGNKKTGVYLQAYKAHQAALVNLVEATREAFPVGTRVMSQQRHGVIIEGVVAGICEYGDYGCVTVRNVRTGKCHRAYPFSAHSHFELIDSGDGS